MYLVKLELFVFCMMAWGFEHFLENSKKCFMSAARNALFLTTFEFEDVTWVSDRFNILAMSVLLLEARYLCDV